MRTRISALFVLAVAFLTFAAAAPAYADHTDPREPQAPNQKTQQTEFRTRGAGQWKHIANFPPNPGTDLKFFFVLKGDIYATAGTLGGGEEGFVGQRMLRLTKDGVVAPEWVADHGSAHCVTNAAGTTGLQHDAALARRRTFRLIIDTTDASGRCHDPSVGGLEFIDVGRIADPNFKPREIHLTRHAGTSHTVTVDATRPWIVYNSSSDFAGRPWIDVLDVRSCLLSGKLSTDQKREQCRPKVYRIPFQPEWSQQRDWQTGELKAGTEAACHDITARAGKIYCAALNATLIFDVSGLTDENGNIRGTPLNCTVIDGTRTTAKVTDCSQVGAENTNFATGAEFLGRYNHPGRSCVPPSDTRCNSNLWVESDEGVAVAHESDPTNDGKWMFVTDERGGGVVPPGSSCFPTIDNPTGNGGAHVFDIRDPSNIKYALNRDGGKAVWISDAIVPGTTFCDIHVMEPLRTGEARFVTAYYTQGTKIVDWSIDRQGRWAFRETASVVFPNANTWAVMPFKVVNRADGTRTYYFMASDIQRGIDIFSWTGPTHPEGARLPAEQDNTAAANVGLLALGLFLLPAAGVAGRRRRARRSA